MPERKLKIGAIVRTRLVPAYAMIQVGRDIKAQVPPPPEVGYKSAAGHTEYKNAPEDSPEFKAYARLLTELDDKLRQLREDFQYDYGIEAWSWDDGVTWLTEPLDSWQFPVILESYGIRPGANRRADYKRYELLILNDDMSVVLNDSMGKTAPITNPEVDAALGGFRGKVPGRLAARGRRKVKG